MLAMSDESAATDEFSYPAPPSILNLIGQLLDGQQALNYAVRAFLEGKGHSEDVPARLRVTAATLSSSSAPTV
jgi:hypothetical protein